jgi:hypothetical protein
VRKDDPVGFAEHPKITFDVYPNPSNDLINIQVSQDFQRIELKSTSGQLLRTSDESSMNINDLKPGPYFLTIYSNGQSLTKRIVKI